MYTVAESLGDTDVFSRGGEEEDEGVFMRLKESRVREESQTIFFFLFPFFFEDARCSEHRLRLTTNCYGVGGR